MPEMQKETENEVFIFVLKYDILNVTVFFIKNAFR